MSEFNISIPSGESRKLKTGGKYCDRDIVVTSESGDVTNVDGEFVLCGKAAEVVERAFERNTLLSAINLPNVLSIGNYAFQNCETITSVNLPSATTLSRGAFVGCKGLLNVDFENVEDVGEYAFAWCDSLTSVNLPSAITFGDGVFKDCWKLVNVNLPSAITFGEDAFNGCQALVNVHLPSAITIGEWMFRGCLSLKMLDLPNAQNNMANAFTDASLETLILRRSDDICNINVTAILGTKIVSSEGVPTGEGFIYVPDVLLEDYVANLTEQATQLTGDSEMAEYIVRAIIRKIEDYPEICG